MLRKQPLTHYSDATRQDYGASESFATKSKGGGGDHAARSRKRFEPSAPMLALQIIKAGLASLNWDSAYDSEGGRFVPLRTIPMLRLPKAKGRKSVPLP